MCVLLGLGGVELRPAGARDDVGQHATERFVRKGDLRGQALLILGEGHEMRQPGVVFALEMVPGLVDNGVAQLARSVRTKVEEDHRVAVRHRRCRVLAERHDAGRNQEFVREPGLVALPDKGDRVGGGRSAGLDHSPIGALGPLPSLVPVHRVVPAADGRDSTGSDPLDLARELLDVTRRTGGRLVTSVGEGVDEHPRHAQRPRHLEQRIQVLGRAVDTAGGHQSHEVQRLARRG